MDPLTEKKNEQKIRDRQRDLKRRSQIYKSVFKTPNGGKMLKDLREEFKFKAVCDNTNRTFLNAGANAVIQFIDEMIALEDVQ